MKPDRIVAAVRMKVTELDESDIFLHVNFRYATLTGKLDMWYTRGVVLHEPGMLSDGTTIAQQSELIELGNDVNCYNFLLFLGEENKNGKLVDIQYREES